MNRKIILGVIGVLIVGLLLIWGKINQKNTVQYWPGTSIACLSNGHQNLVFHIHSHLTIIKNDQILDIPANIGIKPDCMAEVHTHDATGEIHMESTTNQEFSLGQFFAVWGEDFDWSKSEMLLIVNGQENLDDENYLMKDKDIIEVNLVDKMASPAE